MERKFLSVDSHWKRISVGIIVITVGLLVGYNFSFTNPSFIHWRVQKFGAKEVYHSLSYPDDGTWDVVTRGVRSGEPRWLQVAVDLYPQLDTHPGEEMVEAVFDVFEANPIGALNVLLPIYGADFVCAMYADGGSLTSDRAMTRLKLLESIPADAIDPVKRRDCIDAIHPIVRRKAPLHEEKRS